MNTLKKLLLVSAIAASFSSQAAFVQTDWKDAGDKLVITDTDTGIQWLSLNATSFMTMEEVNSQLSTTYAGWRFASNSQVETMMDNFFTIPTDVDFVSYRPGNEEILAFGDVFGNGDTDKGQHYGYYYDEYGFVRFAGGYANEGGRYTGMKGTEAREQLCTNAIAPVVKGSRGVFLVNTGGVNFTEFNCTSGVDYTGSAKTISEFSGTGSSNIGETSDVNVAAPLSIAGLLMLSGAFARRRR